MLSNRASNNSSTHYPICLRNLLPWWRCYLHTHTCRMMLVMSSSSITNNLFAKMIGRDSSWWLAWGWHTYTAHSTILLRHMLICASNSRLVLAINIACSILSMHNRHLYNLMLLLHECCLIKISSHSYYLVVRSAKEHRRTIANLINLMWLLRSMMMMLLLLLLMRLMLVREHFRQNILRNWSRIWSHSRLGWV
jgi:hypothetical protein